MPSFIPSRRRANAIVGMNAKTPPDPEPEVTPLNYIFACSICGDTFSDLYQGHHTDSVQGLSDGINARHRVVTRLYIASCCHAICIKHIENGNGRLHLLTVAMSLTISSLQDLLSTRKANSPRQRAQCVSRRTKTTRLVRCSPCAVSIQRSMTRRFPIFGFRRRQ